MKVYLAAPIFTERDRMFNTYLETEILKQCPQMDLYLAQNNASINDKTGCATSADIYVGDVSRLQNSDMVITIMSGDLPPIGSSYEVSYFCGLCEHNPDKRLVALYDDSREGQHTYSEAKRDAMLSGIAENQWPYINLLAVGFVKKFGTICYNSKEFIKEVVHQYNLFMDNRTSGIYKITNLKNNLVYIGQTINFHQRYLDHWRDYKSDTNDLYIDMRNLGLNYFKFEIIEKCDQDALDEREKFWIEYYDSYNNGYNQTRGGNGFQTWTQQMIGVSAYNLDGSLYQNFPSIASAMRALNLKSNDITRCIECHDNNHISGNKMWRFTSEGLSCIEPYQSPHQGKYIYSYDLNTRLFIKRYENAIQAGKELTGQRQPHINDVANGKRKSCCGFLWSYNYYDKLPENYWCENQNCIQQKEK